MTPNDKHLEKLLVMLGDNNCMATSSHSPIFDLSAKDNLLKCCGTLALFAKKFEMIAIQLKM